MALLKEILPPVLKSSASASYDHTNDQWFKDLYSSSSKAKEISMVKPSINIPQYPQRDVRKFKPLKPEAFGDGGAYPEIHLAQYPLGMARKDARFGQKILPVTVDSHGNIAFDAIVKQNENASKIVYSQYRDLVPKILRAEEEEDEEEQKKVIEETTLQTKAALESIVGAKLSATQPKNVPKHAPGPRFIRYRPSQQSAAFNSGAKEREICMSETPVDPMEPPKFKHKKVPRASGSPPVPILHSPPRPVSVKDQKDWKIPPCISNWKNPKGYTIPLDKRLAADGRGLQDVQINDNFAKLSEALYVAEQKAREAITMRAKVQREMATKENERKKQELRALADKARAMRSGGVAQPASAPIPSDKSNSAYEDVQGREERIRRENIRAERRKERERERRLEAKDAAMGKKSKITRDRDRDVSEKVALGMASAGGSRGEVMYDQRLFNQEKGMDSGFGTDDQYNLYDKAMSRAQNTLFTLYRPKKDMDSEVYGAAEEQMEKIAKTDRFKPDKAFAGTSQKAGARDGPVEFKKNAEEADPFGLDQFLTDMTKGKKALDKVGGGGTMKASGGGSGMRDGHDGGSRRSRIQFERSH